jgi:hypothetical protein
LLGEVLSSGAGVLCGVLVMCDGFLVEGHCVVGFWDGGGIERDYWWWWLSIKARYVGSTWGIEETESLQEDWRKRVTAWFLGCGGMLGIYIPRSRSSQRPV